MKFDFRNAGHGFFTELSYQTQKTSLAQVETTQKTTQKIIDILKENPTISRIQLAEELGNITESGVKYHLNKMVKDKQIQRIGPDKGGHWEIIK